MLLRSFSFPHRTPREVPKFAYRSGEGEPMLSSAPRLLRSLPRCTLREAPIYCQSGKVRRYCFQSRCCFGLFRDERCWRLLKCLPEPEKHAEAPFQPLDEQLSSGTAGFYQSRSLGSPGFLSSLNIRGFPGRENIWGHAGSSETEQSNQQGVTSKVYRREGTSQNSL